MKFYGFQYKLYNRHLRERVIVWFHFPLLFRCRFWFENVTCWEEYGNCLYNFLKFNLFDLIWAKYVSHGEILTIILTCTLPVWFYASMRILFLFLINLMWLLFCLILLILKSIKNYNHFYYLFYFRLIQKIDLHFMGFILGINTFLLIFWSHYMNN